MAAANDFEIEDAGPAGLLVRIRGRATAAVVGEVRAAFERKRADRVALSIDASQQTSAEPAFHAKWVEWLSSRPGALGDVVVLYATPVVEMGYRSMNLQLGGAMRLVGTAAEFTPEPASARAPIAQQRGVVEVGGVRCDLATWPVMVVTPPSTITDAAMFEHLNWLADLRDSRKTRYVIVLNLRESKGLTPGQRKMLTDRMNSGVNADLCAGTAMVFDSALLRGILTAIFWVKKPKYPCQTFKTVPEAVAWGELQIAPESPLRAVGGGRK